MSNDFLEPTTTELLADLNKHMGDTHGVIADMAMPMYVALVDMANNGATTQHLHVKMVELLIRLAHLTIQSDPRRVKVFDLMAYLGELGSELDADETYQDIRQTLWDFNSTMSNMDYVTLAVAVGNGDDLLPSWEMAHDLTTTYDCLSGDA